MFMRDVCCVRFCCSVSAACSQSSACCCGEAMFLGLFVLVRRPQVCINIFAS